MKHLMLNQLQNSSLRTIKGFFSSLRYSISEQGFPTKDSDDFSLQF